MAEIVNGNIHLIKYGVCRCHYEEQSVDAQREYQINPTFKRTINKVEDRNGVFRLELSVCLDSAEADGEKPFDIDVSVFGIFELINLASEKQQEVMETNATAILFPLLRAQLSLFMTIAEVRPLVLPVMNMPALFNTKKAEN